MGCEVPGGDTELLGLTVGTGDGPVAGVADGEGRGVGFGVLVGAGVVGVGAGAGEVEDPDEGRSPEVRLASIDGGLTFA